MYAFLFGKESGIPFLCLNLFCFVAIYPFRDEPHASPHFLEQHFVVLSFTHVHI